MVVITHGIGRCTEVFKLHHFSNPKREREKMDLDVPTLTLRFGKKTFAPPWPAGLRDMLPEKPIQQQKPGSSAGLKRKDSESQLIVTTQIAILAAEKTGWF